MQQGGLGFGKPHLESHPTACNFDGLAVGTRQSFAGGWCTVSQRGSALHRNIGGQPSMPVHISCPMTRDRRLPPSSGTSLALRFGTVVVLLRWIILIVFQMKNKNITPRAAQWLYTFSGKR